jgi:glutathione S-transferase
MKLISSPASPFVRKVRAVILETGLGDRVEELRVATTPLATADAAQAANPLGKIPALIREDGRALHDSRVITRYLDDLAGTNLYPQDRIWDILTLEATADGIMDAAVLVIYEGRLRPETERSNTWVEAQWSKAARAVHHVNDHWTDHLSGPVDAAQIALGCALGYLDFRHAARDWRRDNPALAHWFAGFSTRPCMAATAPADL